MPFEAAKVKRPKTELSESDFKAFLIAHPGLDFDGMRYTTPIKMRGLVWHRPVAYIQDGKFFRFDD